MIINVFLREISPNDEQVYAGREHPLAFGGGPGVSALVLGLLRWSILLSLVCTVILAWCFDMLCTVLIESIGGVWACVVIYFRYAVTKRNSPPTNCSMIHANRFQDS